jgi:hypothetical protein
VTAAGGSTNAGTLFKMTTEGAGYVILFSFPGGAAGGSPSTLIEGSDGVFYGAVHYAGGLHDQVYGAIFALNKDGSGYNLLHLFNTANWDGVYPQGPIPGLPPNAVPPARSGRPGLGATGAACWRC